MINKIWFYVIKGFDILSNNISLSIHHFLLTEKIVLNCIRNVTKSTLHKNQRFII